MFCVDDCPLRSSQKVKLLPTKCSVNEGVCVCVRACVRVRACVCYPNSQLLALSVDRLSVQSCGVHKLGGAVVLGREAQS